MSLSRKLLNSFRYFLEMRAVGGFDEYRVALMQKLGSDAREVMYLRIFGALSFRDIGEILSRTENWARVTYYRGREALRKELEKDDEK